MTNDSTESKEVQAEADTDDLDRNDLDRDSTVVGGLDENVAGTLSYVFGFITGLIFFLVETENEFVRFHAAQSMLVFGGLFVLSFVIGALAMFLELIPFVGWIFSLMLGLVSLLIAPVGFVLWIVLMYKAYSGERYGLPVVGEVAEGWV